MQTLQGLTNFEIVIRAQFSATGPWITSKLRPCKVYDAPLTSSCQTLVLRGAAWMDHEREV